MPTLAPPPTRRSPPKEPRTQPPPPTAKVSVDPPDTSVDAGPTELVRHEYRFSSGQAWYDAIGRVPLDRVVFDPLPGTATEADVIRLDDHEDMLCELVYGTLVSKAVGFKESQIGGNLFAAMHAFVRRLRLGLITPADGMMRLLRRQVRIPDISFISYDSLPDGKLPPGAAPPIRPDLAVEVISESNSEMEMHNKLGEYFEAGTKLVWYIYPLTRTIDVYTAIDQKTTLDEGDTLTGGDVLPGFEIKVAEVFDVG